MRPQLTDAKRVYIASEIARLIELMPTVVETKRIWPGARSSRRSSKLRTIFGIMGMRSRGDERQPAEAGVLRYASGLRRVRLALNRLQIDARQQLAVKAAMKRLRRSAGKRRPSEAWHEFAYEEMNRRANLLASLAR